MADLMYCKQMLLYDLHALLAIPRRATCNHADWELWNNSPGFFGCHTGQRSVMTWSVRTATSRLCKSPKGRLSGTQDAISYVQFSCESGSLARVRVERSWLSSKNGSVRAILLRHWQRGERNVPKEAHPNQSLHELPFRD